MDTTTPSPDQPKPQVRSRLLSLPTELQLQIYEYAIISTKPLMVNCPCDSSFGGWTADYDRARELWRSGALAPPMEPALTRTCRSIRAETLRMFYARNAFQAGYCFNTDPVLVVGWLERLGPEKRAWLRRFYFFDENPLHDEKIGRDLERVRGSKVCLGMGGVLVPRSTQDFCRHDVMFPSSAASFVAESSTGV